MTTSLSLSDSLRRKIKFLQLIRESESNRNYQRTQDFLEELINEELGKVKGKTPY